MSEIEAVIARLKCGEYDGTDIMRAWCEIAQLRAERDRYKKALEEISDMFPQCNTFGIAAARGVARTALEASNE